MYSLAIKFLLAFTLIGAISHTAFAAEEKKEEKKEEPAGEKKEEKKEVKSSEESYASVVAKVQALEAKVASNKEEIEKLIEEKQTTKDPAKVSEIVKQMVTLHKQMQANVKDYDQQRSLLKYRYPEKGQAEKREYERIEVKSLDEMEGQMSLGNSVKKTLTKVRSQYEAPDDLKKNSKNEKDPHGASPQQQGPSITDPVIIKK
jgi:hypothetical protein